MRTITITSADLASARQMAAAIDECVTLESWIRTETQDLGGDEAAETARQCRAVWSAEARE